MSLVEMHSPAGASDMDGQDTAAREANIICLGNEKGGSGKSTTAMHIIVALMLMGQRVGAIDLDGRQQSLSRYIQNRQRWAEKNQPDLPIPELATIARSNAEMRTQAEAEEKQNFDATIVELSKTCDYIVIDSPGNDTYLSRLGHARADLIITPINDSFVDMDLLAEVDPETGEILGPSLYSEMVWESRKRRALADRVSIDWVLMRNRLSSLDAKNKRKMSDTLDKLAPRTGFRVAPGFGERVIYRELFPVGLTLLDINENTPNIRMNMSHVAARQELRDLMVTLNLPGLEEASRSF